MIPAEVLACGRRWKRVKSEGACSAWVTAEPEVADGLCLKAVNSSRSKKTSDIDKACLNILKEASFLRQYSSTGFPRLLQVDANGAGLLMEKKKGRLLSTCASSLTTLERIGLLRDLLSFAHTFEGPVIHRDIKPRNILINKRAGGLATSLIDFGSMERVYQARSDHGPRESKLGSGKYLYQPPEQLVSLYEEFGTTVDAFAIGATFFSVEFGHPPYTNDEANPKTVLASYSAQENRIWRAISERMQLGDIRECLFSLLRAKPRVRFGDFRALFTVVETHLALIRNADHRALNNRHVSSHR